MKHFKEQDGFTLMEIVVASTVFAMVVAALMSMFNYTLKINRRTDSLRQATQSMRNLIEFIVKEVRNGEIDYRVAKDLTAQTAVGPCQPPTINVGTTGNTYGVKDNRLAIRTPESDIECIYLAYGPGNTAGQDVGDWVNIWNQYPEP
jgi:prepilin-type N-terminal cleavage/methylation domain-containing protein